MLESIARTSHEGGGSRAGRVRLALCTPIEQAELNERPSQTMSQVLDLCLFSADEGCECGSASGARAIQ
jgi:hypothetical protein